MSVTRQQLAGITVQLLGHIHCFSQYLISTIMILSRILIDKARFLIQESFDNVLDMEKLASQLPIWGILLLGKSLKNLQVESPNHISYKSALWNVQSNYWR